MSRFHMLSRRIFLWELGKGVLAAAILGAGVACGGSDDDPPPQTSDTDATEPETGAEQSDGAGELTWTRAALGSVSAYVLVRGREAAIVDTGLEGSEAQIGETVAAAGLGWADVRHVIVTHKHPDHAGSLAGVLAAADGATAWAGEADIAAIKSPRTLEVAADGAEVFGLQIVATPGHTPGHLCVFDPDAGLLVTGDAISNRPEGVAGPNPQYSEDMSAAGTSVKKLAGLAFDTLLFGHGDPIEGGAKRALEQLTATLS